MRTYLHINLKTQTVEKEELHGEAIAKAGRYLIAKTFVEKGLAQVEPLSPENPVRRPGGLPEKKAPAKASRS